MPGIINLVKIRCHCTMLFLDLYLAEGRNYNTGSWPKITTFSSVILKILLKKENNFLNMQSNNLFKAHSQLIHNFHKSVEV